MNIRLPVTLSTVILRIGVALVFVFFGFDKFRQPEAWVHFVDPKLLFYAPFSPTTAMYTLGGIEVITGTMLFIGLFTRVFALIAALNLAGIILTLGINEITLRDMAILAAALSLVLTGSPAFSIDATHRMGKKKKQKEYIELT